MYRGWLAVFLLILAATAVACGNHYYQAKLDTTPQVDGFIAAGEGASVDRLVYLLTGWALSNAGHQMAGEDRDRRIPIPLPAYLIEHRGQYVLVDTGMAPSLATEPSRYLSKTMACLAEDRLRELTLLPEWSVPARLKEMGGDPAKVQTVILTHAHFDHTGANRAFLHAEFLLTREIVEAGRHGGIFNGYWDKDFPAEMKIQPVDFSGTQPFLTFTGSYDLFGDGAVILVPLPGHDPGNQGVFVRTKKGPVLLVGDAAYTMRNILELHMPGWAYDDEAEWETLHRLRRLVEVAPEIRIIPSHDPEVFRALPTAPESL